MLHPARVACLAVVTSIVCLPGAACVSSGHTASSPGTPVAAIAGATDAPPAPTLRWLGSGPRVAMFEAELAPGARFAAPNDGCQDVLVYVREGLVEPIDASGPLASGEAARLAAGAARRTTLVARAPTRLFVVLARDETNAFHPGATLDDFAAPAGCAAGEAAPTDVRSDPTTRGPFVRNDGALRVFIHLDAPHQGASLAGLGQLDADPTVAVPLHVHEASDEILYFESGDGTMMLGDESFAIEPGRFVYVPRGVPHAFTPSGRAPMRAFQSYAPSGPEQRFRAPAPAAPPAVEANSAPPAPPAATPVPCSSERDCWVEPAPTWHPIARPRALRGRTYRPCRDGEHQPMCSEGVCAIRGVSC